MIHLDFTKKRIVVYLEELLVKIKKNILALRRSSPVDRLVHEKLAVHNEERQFELHKLLPSPYFVRCEIIFDKEPEAKIFYFGKFAFTEESIYSWVTPIASVRFEGCGRISYKQNNGKIRHGTLIRKDQFMIADGKIIFMSTESVEDGRTLVYQDYFSSQKKDFALVEIVEQMEKAQDQVIRADSHGPLVISGPAGSGKTTLALHRVAYLAQSPESCEEYPGNTIIVFVQDENAKKYFSSLLPNLGINNVTIITFSEWAFGVLSLTDVGFIGLAGDTEKERDILAHEKNQLIKSQIRCSSSGNCFSNLDQIYKENLSPASYRLFQDQKKKRNLDRLDLTILLLSAIKNNDRLEIEKKYYVQQKDYSLVERYRRTPIEYSMIIIDEFQNYLPEQLNIIKSCVRPRTNSIVYVGDMRQQIRLFTINNWSEIGEEIPSERIIELKKVYRNTKNILEYIQEQGFNISLPEEMKPGKAVVEKIFLSPEEEIDYIENVVGDSEKIVGVIAWEKSYLKDFAIKFSRRKNIILLSMEEAQGMEFDLVFLVGLDVDFFDIPEYGIDTLCQEKRKITKDLLYVALTRAIEELHVLGRVKLSELSSKFR